MTLCSRRQSLGALLALPVMLNAPTLQASESRPASVRFRPEPARRPLLAFVGSRTTRERQARGVGLSVYEISPEGRWQHRQTLDLVNPSYLLVDAARRTLHTVHGDLSDISAFSIGAEGRLNALGRRSTRGINPVHLAFDATRSRVIVANYATGSLCSLPIAEDGSLGEADRLLTLSGQPGLCRRQQTGPHPHQVLPWPGTSDLLIPDKGLDRVHWVRADSSGDLHHLGEMVAAPGAGCRHAALDADRGRMWLVNELDVTVTLCQVEAQACSITPLETVALLPVPPDAETSAAGIVRQDDMLYVSLRGRDEVVALRIDPAHGRPKVVQTLPTGGRTPRFITLSPDGRDLLVAHEGSDTVVGCAVQPDGGLGAPRVLIETGSPVCIDFLRA
jgi:6-phosphogluconolactonase (cycloisomerase 2 family)